MTSVLGVSVGASAVRFARHDAVSLDTPIFESRSVTATLERPEELAAESIGTVLAERDEVDEVQAIGVAYQDEAQAGAVQAAMARLQIGNFQLVPEVTAALQMLEMSGELGDHATLVFYDLGSSGLTVTVVDRDTGMVLSSARSDQISGDLVDRLICDNQLELQRFAHPADAAAALALAARCRDAKEQLSTHGAVCMPGEGGLLLLTQDGFDSLIASPVETSARLTREVIRRSGRVPDAAVLIGGGAHIPLVTSVMESWLDLPVIVPAQPELVAAEGAALLARPMSEEFVGAAAPLLPDEEFDAQPWPQPDAESWTESPADEAPPARRRRGFVLAGSAVAVVAAIGLGLGIGVGTDLLGSDEEAQPAATQQATQAPSVQRAAPAPPTTTADVPPSADSVPSAVAEQPVIPPQTEVRSTYQSRTQAQTQTQTQSPAQAPVVPGTGAVPSDTSAPTTTPEPAPLIPGLPQFQLPTIPPPAPLPVPELPRIPGL